MMLAQQVAQKVEGLTGETLGISAGFTVLLLSLLRFTWQLHADGKADRATAAAERVQNADAYKETATMVAKVVDRNTESHVRANVIMARVEERMDREEKRAKS